MEDLAHYNKKRISVNKSQFVSTENMKQNCEGIELYNDTSLVDGIEFHKNDILIANIRPYLKKAWKAEFNGACSSDVLSINPAEINADFFFHCIEKDDFFNYVMSAAKGSKMPRGDKQHIMEYKISIPTTKEQKRISDFIDLINCRISYQQKIVDALKLYKRGVLSQIFNQSLSFDGSATRWQKKTIGDIFAERCERANGDEELLAVTINAGIQKRDDIDKKDNSSENKSNYKKVYPGDIAYNTMRMWQGASGYSSFDGIVSPAYTVIYPIEPNKQNIVFWAYYFKDLDLIKKFQKYSQGLTSDTWNLKFAQLADIHTYEPPYETQCNIANFLTKFDNKITIAEHYCIWAFIWSYHIALPFILLFFATFT